MNTGLLLFVLALLFTVIHYTGLVLLSRWLKKWSEQGIWGIAVAIIGLSVVGSAILLGVFTFLAYLLGETLRGLVIDIPVYFGMPWYGLVLYGAGIGVITFFGWSYYNRPMRTLPIQRLKEIPECEEHWVKLGDLARYLDIDVAELWDLYFDRMVQPMTRSLVLVAFKRRNDFYMGGVNRYGKELSGREANFGTATFFANLSKMYITADAAKKLF